MSCFQAKSLVFFISDRKTKMHGLTVNWINILSSAKYDWLAVTSKVSRKSEHVEIGSSSGDVLKPGTPKRNHRNRRDHRNETTGTKPPEPPKHRNETTRTTETGIKTWTKRSKQPQWHHRYWIPGGLSWIRISRIVSFVALVFALFTRSFSGQTLQISRNLQAFRDRICHCLWPLCTQEKTLYIGWHSLIWVVKGKIKESFGFNLRTCFGKLQRLW